MLSTASTRDLSPQERNARLQDLVRSFVLRATDGVTCQIVDAITGYSWPARYVIDSRLQQIVVEVNDKMRWTCRISDVQHIRIWPEEAQDHESFFPVGLRNFLSTDELQRLVMLEQKDGSRLCLLEEEAGHAEELRVAISILGLYAREQGSAAQQPVAAAAAASKNVAQQLGETTNGRDADLISVPVSIQPNVPDLLL